MRSFRYLACAFSWLPALAAQSRYALPPQPLVDCVLAPPPPQVSLAPTGKTLALVAHEGLPSLETVARPMLGLAGRRIDPATRGGQRGTRGTGITLVAVADPKPRAVALPAECDVGAPIWSADGKRFAFTNTTNAAIELWVCDVANATAKRVEGVRLCATLASPVRWHSDQDHLLCFTVANPGPASAAPRAPLGPSIEEVRGTKTPVRTYPDLLRSERDEQLFEHYMTSQLVMVDAASGAVQPIGAPALWESCDASPGGEHLLVKRLVRPFSYRIGAQGFPSEVLVLDLAGKTVRTIAALPSEETVPIEGVPTGPRAVRWEPGQPATLTWVEALDGGNPKTKVEARDRVMRSLALDAGGERVRSLFTTQHRFQGMQTLGAGRGRTWNEYDRDRKWRRSWVQAQGLAGDQPVVWHEGSTQDAYGDPGRPVTELDARGDSHVVFSGSTILLEGDGSSPAGDRPFLDRLDLATKKRERLFECATQRYERVVKVLSEDANLLLITSESKTEAPNWYVLDRSTATRTAVTNFVDPVAALTKGITKQRLEYDRKDGTKLTATLYLPPGHEAGNPLPVFVWAYPREFTDAATAGQVRGSEHRYTRLSPLSPLMMLLAGYAVLDDASMPVVGPPETANDTFVEQIVASAQAAIDKVVALGVGDRARFAVGGHSYGAFMTANLLAHCNLFQCGIARSGAYNRTLTPFGFQSERRTYWEAPQIYHALSPFSYADKIDEPLLLIHGEADDNPGTFPVQSQRLFQAISGHGGKARLVMLPHEAHGYRAKESVLHVLAEMVRWLDANLKPVR